MSLYSHCTDAELLEKRTRLMSALEELLISPTEAAGNGRSVKFQQRPEDLRRELGAINNEISRREGRAGGGPIYLA